jgi:hypothetical protein
MKYYLVIIRLCNIVANFLKGRVFSLTERLTIMNCHIN